MAIFFTAIFFPTTRLLAVLTLVVVTLAAATSALGQDWGTLRGRFVYDGMPPERAKCNVTKDQAVCQANHPLVETIVVDPQGGVANIAVWLVTENVNVHPDYAKTAKATIEMDNKNCRFEPHVVAVRTGQTLRLSNSDPVQHNVNGAAFRKNKAFNDSLAPGAKIDKVLTGEERLGVQVSCGSHGWMSGWVLVKETPYIAVSTTDGTFEITNLPAGSNLEFKTWHAPSGYIMKPSIDGKEENWKRGQFTFTIAAGDNDMGDILLSPAELK